MWPGEGGGGLGSLLVVLAVDNLCVASCKL